MSIASEIQALQNDKTDISNALVSKGVGVPSGSGFDDFADLIKDIPEGWDSQYLSQTLSHTGAINSFTVSGLQVNPKMAIVANAGASYSDLLTAVETDTSSTTRICASKYQFSAQFGTSVLNSGLGGYRNRGVSSIGDCHLTECILPDGRTLQIGYPQDVKKGSLTFGTRYLAGNYVIWLAGERIKTDAELILIANGLGSTPSTIVLGDAEKTICTEIKGYNENGTFTADQNGNITLTYFITQVKGWTII